MKLNYYFKPTLVKKINYITHKGKQRNFEGQRHQHPQNYYEIIYVDYGTIRISINDDNLELGPGECLIIPGDTKHEISGKDGAPFDFMNILFQGNVPPKLLNECLPFQQRCHDLVEQLKGESSHSYPFSHEVIACYLTQFVALLYRFNEVTIPDSIPDPAYQRRYQSEIVNRAIAIISKEYSSQLTLKQLSKSTGVSESYLRSLLTKETGENFSSLLHQQRITTAKHLIRESAYSLEEIANAIGYQSLSFFYKIFKRLTGMTPRTYARSLGDPEE